MRFLLTALLLPLLAACGGDGGPATPPKATSAAPPAAVGQGRPAKAEALDALRQAQEMEQMLQDSADRRQREMDAQGK